MVSFGIESEVALQSEDHCEGVGIVATTHGMNVGLLWFDDRECLLNFSMKIQQLLQDEEHETRPRPAV